MRSKVSLHGATVFFIDGFALLIYSHYYSLHIPDKQFFFFFVN